MTDYEKELIRLLKTRNKMYMPITNKSSLMKIFKMYTNNIIFEAEPDNMEECAYLARYYYDNKDRNMMKKYHHMMRDNINVFTAANLGNYYQNIEKYDEMTKYYDKVIEFGKTHESRVYFIVMIFIGNYHRKVTKNDDLSLEYYMKALECDDKYVKSRAHNLIGVHYHNKRNDKMSRKNYKQSISLSNDNNTPMYNLGQQYRLVKPVIDKMMRYFIMAHNNKHPLAMDKLLKYFSSHDINYNKLEQEPSCT